MKFNLDFCDTPTFKESDICFYANNIAKIDTQKNCKAFICTKDNHGSNHFSYCTDWMRFFILDDFTPRVFSFNKDDTKFVNIFYKNNKSECIHNKIYLSDLKEKLSPADLIYNYFIFEKSLDKLVEPNLLSYLEHYGNIVKVDKCPEEQQFNFWLKLSYQNHLITRSGKREFINFRVIMHAICERRNM